MQRSFRNFYAPNFALNRKSVNWLFHFIAATVITTAPSDKTVNASSTVTFECDASTDREEQDHLEIKWLKGGEEIDYESEPSITLNKRVCCLHIYY